MFWLFGHETRGIDPAPLAQHGKALTTGPPGESSTPEVVTQQLSDGDAELAFSHKLQGDGAAAPGPGVTVEDSWARTNQKQSLWLQPGRTSGMLLNRRERLRADSDRRGGCGCLRLPFRHRQTVDWSPGGWSQGPWGGTDA